MSADTQLGEWVLHSEYEAFGIKYRLFMFAAASAPPAQEPSCDATSTAGPSSFGVIGSSAGSVTAAVAQPSARPSSSAAAPDGSQPSNTGPTSAPTPELELSESELRGWRSSAEADSSWHRKLVRQALAAHVYKAALAAERAAHEKTAAWSRKRAEDIITLGNLVGEAERERDIERATREEAERKTRILDAMWVHAEEELEATLPNGEWRSMTKGAWDAAVKRAEETQSQLAEALAAKELAERQAKLYAEHYSKMVTAEKLHFETIDRLENGLIEALAAQKQVEAERDAFKFRAETETANATNAQRWLAQETDRANALTSALAECERRALRTAKRLAERIERLTSALAGAREALSIAEPYCRYAPESKKIPLAIDAIARALPTPEPAKAEEQP